MRLKIRAILIFFVRARVFSTGHPTRSHIVRLQVKSDGSVFDPAVQSFILEQVSRTVSLKVDEVLCKMPVCISHCLPA